MRNVRRWTWIALGLCSACGKAETPASATAPSIAGNFSVSAGTVAAPVSTSSASNIGAGALAAVSGRPGVAGSVGVAAAGRGSAGVAGASVEDTDAGVNPVKPSTPAVTPTGPRGTGPGDWVAGDYPKDTMTWLEISGLPHQPAPRQYRVHVPPSYDPKVPTPVVFCIHGLGQDANLFCVDGAGMPAKSNSAGFILVMPNGYQNSWNAGTCCGDAATQHTDDVGLFRAIFAEISKHVNVDLGRVYATGLSNGAYMSYRLACEAADIFVAVAPGAGAIGMDDIGGGTSADGDWEACKPTAKVSVLDLHGTEDPLIPYALQKPTLERISAANGCMTTTHPATQPSSAGDTTCVTYDGCPAGVDVTACSVKGGGHVWFGSPNCGTGVDAACAIVGANSQNLMNTDAVWSFFSAHTRP